MKLRNFMIFVFFLMITSAVVLLFSGRASGFDFDNSVDYSNGDKTITITNLFGLGSTIGKADLTTPLNGHKVLVGENRIVMTYDFYEFDNYKNGLGEVIFIDMNTRKQIDKSYHFEEITYEYYTAPNWETTCKLEKNGTETCTSYINHYETIPRMIRTPYNSKVLDKSITLALVTNVNEGESIDGKWKIAGKYADRHAIWNATKDEDLIHYYKFDDVTGSDTNATDELNLQNNNFTVILGNFSSAGAINRMLNYSETGYMNGSSQFNAEITGNHNRTINFWSYTQASTADTSGIFGWGGTGAKQGFYVLLIGNKYAFYDYINTIDSGITTHPSWLMHTVTTNGTGVKYYINGTQVGSLSNNALTTTATEMFIGRRLEIGSADWYNGTMDELAIWNRTLSDSEIDDLWNSGRALAYKGETSISVSLDSPVDAFETIDTSFFFSGDFNWEGIGNFTNSTLFVWNPDNTLFGNNRSDINGTTNSTNLSLSNFVIGDDYKWNYYSCGINDTSNNICDFAVSNKTFDIKAFEENSQTFSSQAFEQTNETFTISINYTSAIHSPIYAFLEYNNTVYSGAQTGTGDTISFSKEIDLPSVNTNTNISFHWEFLYSGSKYYNSTFQNQTIDSISLDDCSTNTVIVYNFTLWAEETPSKRLWSHDNSTLSLDFDITNVDTQTLATNYSGNFSHFNETILCINAEVLNTSSFRVDAIVQYNSDGRIAEFYNIQKFTLTNATIPQTIKLFDILTTDSQEFLITYKDDSFIPVGDAIIDITRRYIGEGLFRTVEKPITDSDGSTLGHFVLGDEIYTLIVSKERTILGTFSNIVPRCDDLSTGNCKINLNSFSSGTGFENTEEENNLAWSFTLDKPNRKIDLGFSVLDSSVSTINITGILFDNLGNTTICTDQLASSSGTLTCSVPVVWGNSSVEMVLRKDGSFISQEIFSFVPTMEEIYGAEGKFTVLLLGLLLFLTIPLMFITSTVGVVIGAIVGLILMVLLNLTGSGNILGATSSVIWLIIAGGIIIWKITNRENGI